MPSTTALLSLHQQRLLLQMEYEAERQAFERQSEAVGLRRKVKRGDAWWPVRVGRHYWNSLNQLTVELFRTTDEEIEHSFEFGRPLLFFTLSADAPPSAPVSYLKETGVVSYVDGDRMVVTLPDNSTVAHWQDSDGLGVQLGFDETSYRLMFDAIDRVTRARDNRLAYLRDLFYSTTPAQTFHFPSITFPWLNSTQQQAVNDVLRAKDVLVVHGPPGTGKTTTLVEAISETLRRESQVLVCAQSNMAVDWISEQLTDRGINVLRVGNPTRVNDKMLSFTYERRFEAHPDYPQLWSIRKAIREIRGQKRRAESTHQKLDRLKSRATEIELRIHTQLFDEARVIASTLTGAANRVLEGRHFTTLFIDEAAQALEAACWIAIRRCSRVIFAGDHCQLPPTVKNIDALRGGLGVTLMERIVHRKPEVVRLLQVQYRMSEPIMRFSSDYFYEGKVQTAPEIRHRSVLDYDIPMTWIDTADMDFQEEFIGESFGRVNMSEAELTLLTLQRYYSRIGKERILEERIDCGIISPYRAQVQYLRRQIRRHEFFKPFRHLISVNTIDGFQGQERDVILISLVRANDEGQIGFLRDLRRMNVAITRARMKLFILGDSSTMTRHPFYRKLYEYIQRLNDKQYET